MPPALPAAPLIAVTRQGDEAGELGQHLRELGARVVEVPLIRFLPSPQGATRLDDLSGVDWLLLTSPQGASFFLQAVAGFLQAVAGRQWPEIKIAAVGASTARVLTEGGVQVDYFPAEAGARFLGPGLPARGGETALHLTSQLAEDALEKALTARGIHYERAELYRTEPAELTAQQQDLLRGAAAVTLASGSAARSLAALASADFDPLTLPVAVMGPQTAAAAQNAGFRRVSLAGHTSLRGLAEAAISGAQKQVS